MPITHPRTWLVARIPAAYYEVRNLKWTKLQMKWNFCCVRGGGVPVQDVRTREITWICSNEICIIIV